MDSRRASGVGGHGPGPRAQESSHPGQPVSDGHGGVLGHAEHRYESLGLAVLGDVADTGLQGAITAAPGWAGGPPPAPGRSRTGPAPATIRASVATPALSRPVTPTRSPGRDLERHVADLAAGRAGRHMIDHQAGLRARPLPIRRGRHGRRPGSARASARVAATSGPTIAETSWSLDSPPAGAGEHQLTVPDDRDVLADLEDLLEMMRDVQDRDAARGELPDPREEPFDAAAFQRRGRLVEQQAAGPGGERPGDLDDLPLLHGQVRAGQPHIDRETPLGHDLPGPRPASAASPPGRPGCGWRPRNTFSATVRPGTTMECWNTVAIWRRQAPTRPGGSGGAVEAHLAAVRRVDAAQDGDQGGLASPVAADQAQAAPGPQGEVDSAQRLGAAELLVDACCLGRRDGGRGSGCQLPGHPAEAAALHTPPWALP